MYEFMGRKLNIEDVLLNKYKVLMHGPLNDNAVAWYINLEHDFEPQIEPDKLMRLSDEEITSVVIKHMNREMEPMQP